MLAAVLNRLAVPAKKTPTQSPESLITVNMPNTGKVTTFPVFFSTGNPAKDRLEGVRNVANKKGSPKHKY